MSTFWTVLLNTGLRFGEAAALRWQDVNVDSGLLRVQHTITRVPRGQGDMGGFKFTPPKSHSSRRVVPLNLPARRALVAQGRVVDQLREFATEWADPDLVFPNSVGKPQREDHVLAAFHKVCESAGLPRKRLHDLRHSAATLAQANGADLHEFKNMLGHSRIDVTSHIYTGYSVERVRGAMESVGALLGHNDSSEFAAIAHEGQLPRIYPSRRRRRVARKGKASIRIWIGAF